MITPAPAAPCKMCSFPRLESPADVFMHFPLSVFKQHLGKCSKRSHNSSQCPPGVLIYFYCVGCLPFCIFFLVCFCFPLVLEAGLTAEQRWCSETEATELRSANRYDKSR